MTINKKKKKRVTGLQRGDSDTSPESAILWNASRGSTESPVERTWRYQISTLSSINRPKVQFRKLVKKEGIINQSVCCMVTLINILTALYPFIAMPNMWRFLLYCGLNVYIVNLSHFKACKKVSDFHLNSNTLHQSVTFYRANVTPSCSGLGAFSGCSQNSQHTFQIFTPTTSTKRENEATKHIISGSDGGCEPY